jgi:phage-related protein
MTDSEENIEVSLRPLIWMGDSRKNIREFPEDVRASIGYALQLVQAGETPLEAKHFKGVGSGVSRWAGKKSAMLRCINTENASTKWFVYGRTFKGIFDS